MFRRIVCDFDFPQRRMGFDPVHPHMGDEVGPRLVHPVNRPLAATREVFPQARHR
jgi:hypothetical protein